MSTETITAPALRETRVPGVGPVLETPDAGWRVRDCGSCIVLYRRVTFRDESWWETWEPDLPYGQATILTIDDAVHFLAAEVERYGDRPARVA